MGMCAIVSLPTRCMVQLLQLELGLQSARARSECEIVSFRVPALPGRVKELRSKRAYVCIRKRVPGVRLRACVWRRYCVGSSCAR